ncbi:unnamed protein product [Phytomonas sp. Hart1]|nr:unnamed protein product [Phytomonas sp. Hart1]|eukprot:CCW69050.1 unnamed protein product [Phytomonas sp. isolate Hart1]
MSHFQRDYKPNRHTDAFASLFSTVAETPRGPDTVSIPPSNQHERSKSSLSSEIPYKSFLFLKPPASLNSVELAELPSLLKKVITDSLQGYLYENAIFYAERLYDLVPDYRNLYILADCYVQSGDIDTACRLLRSYYPFFEVHVSRPSSAGPCPAPRAAFKGDGGGGIHPSLLPQRRGIYPSIAFPS